MKSARVNSVQKGVAYIRSQQLSNGGFSSFSGPAILPFQPSLVYSTTFTPALILAALSSVDSVPAVSVRKSLAAWLLDQRSPAWSFNYWAADAPERKHLPYPDDLDDTFCTLIALHQHDPSLIDESCLANVVKLLIATESQVGGPYRTWLAGKDAPTAWTDVDLAVNTNVAGFLRLVADPLPNLTKMIEEAISAEAFKSPYYPSPYPIVYYMSRAYAGPHTQALVQWLELRLRDGWWGNPLHTALAISSLVRLGHAELCKAAVQRLAVSQQADGAWPAIGFCIDPSIKNKAHYSGSAALTTAFAVEALTAYDKAAQKPLAASESRDKTDQTAALLLRQVTAAVLAETAELNSVFKAETQAALKRTIDQDSSHEITLLPYYFNESLINPLPISDSDLMVALGAANTCGWTAYTIYDDFLDNEGIPKLLSVANTTLRHSLRFFDRALPANPEFQRLTTRTFDTIDGANTWELLHCRMPVTPRTIVIGELPTYETTRALADRSLGHTLAPLGVLAASGISPDDARAKAVALALCHYIAARQLSDDLHDWEQDLRSGIITYVVARILQESGTPPGTYTFTKLIPKLQRHFWHHTLPAICPVITRHTTLARRATRSSGLFVEDNVVTQLVKKIDLTIQQTLAEHSKAEAFLTAYKN